MQACLPHVVPWKDSVKLYPQGDWLVLPQEYPGYVHLIDGQPQALDLGIQPLLGCQERLSAWSSEGLLEDVGDLGFMDSLVQNLPTPVQSYEGKLGGLPVYSSHTKGYRSTYQDASAFFSVPMDTLGTWCYITALFDGHGPALGGDGVAKILSESEGLQTLTMAMSEWSQRLDVAWSKMSDHQIENGWQFVILNLQKMIEEHVVNNLHQSNVAAQARNLALALQQTLMSMSHVTEAAKETLQEPIKELQRLQELMESFSSLEGVGSTAVYTIWKVDAQLDIIDLWVVSVGDSWAGLVMQQGPHYALVEEASVANPRFQKDIVSRGGTVMIDEEGTPRLNGQYSLCRGLGDLFAIREWTEVKACVQMKGMSPRAQISKVRLCEHPTGPGELAFDAAMAFVHHCDGLKEGQTLSSSQICSFLKRALGQTPSEVLEAACRLIARAVEGGSHDNCTLQAIDLSALANPSFRKRFYRQIRPSLVFQPSTFYHGFL